MNSIDKARGTSPLSGLRVLEIGYGVAAPVACRTLAEFGADVIRVESARRPDSLRTIGAGWVPLDTPWEILRDTGMALQFTCPEKRSIGLEIDCPEGREVFCGLLARSDVLVMNLGVEAIKRLQLGYEDLRDVNPALVYMNMPAFGSAEGPYRTYRTWGGNVSALAGLTQLVGWPDRDPVGMPMSFPDYPSALWGAAAVVCAIMRRDVTGQGCEIDLSQFLVAIACIGATITETALGGSAPEAPGNRRSGQAPHGVYPTREPDRWVAVSVPNEAAWKGICSVAGLEELGADARFTTVAGREKAQDELDEILGEWTVARTAWETAAELQGVGVESSPVQDNWEVLADPQLAARDFFRVLPSRRFTGELSYGQAVVLSETPAGHQHAAPAFAEHTHEVLRDVAGLDEEQIDALVTSGVAHVMAYPDLHLERPFLHWIRHVMRLPWPPAALDPATILFDQLANAEHEGSDREASGGR